MDIRFLKGLTPNVGYLFYKNHVNFSPTPSLDIISIGVGQIIRNHSIYVPIYGLNSPYHITKITSQEGGSNIVEPVITPKTKVTTLAKEGTGNDSNIVEKGVDNELEKLNGQNSKKRKINNSVLASFQNPLINTKTLQIGGKKKSNTVNTFKFRIVD
jgi:hypothetical protein